MLQKKPNPQLFFIIGRSRSGTTLLRTLLDSHANVSIPNECTFILQLSRKYKNIKNWTPEIIENFTQHLKSTWLFDNLKIDINHLKKRLLDLNPKLTFQDVCQEIIIQSSNSNEKQELKWIGDKNPSYSLYLESIYSIFKNDCKYIYINRDYRDQFWSLINAKIEIPNAVLSAKRWVKAFAIFKKLSDRNTDNFHYLTYEDLVSNPENELQKICLFLNIAYSPSMLQYNDPVKLAATFSEESLKTIHKSLKEPLTQEKINSWINNLNTKQIQILDKIAGKLNKLTGYMPATKTTLLKYILISFPGYLLYWSALFSSILIHLVPFRIYLKLMQGAFLGRIWNQNLRR